MLARTWLVGVLAAVASVASGVSTVGCKGGADAPVVQPGAVAGHVVEVHDAVTATRAGVTRTLAVGNEISGDDVIDTGTAGSIVIELAHNGAHWSLGAAQHNKRVAESAAWSVPRDDHAMVAGNDPVTGAAGRAAERAGAEGAPAGAPAAAPLAPKQEVATQDMAAGAAAPSPGSAPVGAADQIAPAAQATTDRPTQHAAPTAAPPPAQAVRPMPRPTPPPPPPSVDDAIPIPPPMNDSKPAQHFVSPSPPPPDKDDAPVRGGKSGPGGGTRRNLDNIGADGSISGGPAAPSPRAPSKIVTPVDHRVSDLVASQHATLAACLPAATPHAQLVIIVRVNGDAGVVSVVNWGTLVDADARACIQRALSAVVWPAISAATRVDL